MPDKVIMILIFSSPLGLLTTYFEENKVNVLHVYENKSGLWLKMPLSWELHIQDVSSRVTAIQEAFPEWDDRFEILALLRQCNYDLDEVTNTYLNLLAEDVLSKKGSSKRLKGRSGSSQDHSAEVELLKEKVEQLEEQLREKESQLEESKAANEDLKARLKSSEEAARKLQVKTECQQLEIEQLKSAPDPEPVLPVIEVVQPVIEKVQPTIEVIQPVAQPAQPVIPTPTPPPPPPPPPAAPKAPAISKETCRNIKVSVRLFSRMLVELKNCFNVEMEGIALIMGRAQSSLGKMKDVDQGSGKELAELRALYHKEVMQRKLLYNQLQELRGNIRVFCRCRYDRKADTKFEFVTDQDLNVTSASGQKKSFRFDRVFPPSSTQEEVFQDTMPVITSCVDGYNVCIMAYGQTGVSFFAFISHSRFFIRICE